MVKLPHIFMGNPIVVHVDPPAPREETVESIVTKVIQDELRENNIPTTRDGDRLYIRPKGLWRFYVRFKKRAKFITGEKDEEQYISIEIAKPPAKPWHKINPLIICKIPIIGDWANPDVKIDVIAQKIVDSIIRFNAGADEMLSTLASVGEVCGEEKGRWLLEPRAKPRAGAARGRAGRK